VEGFRHVVPIEVIFKDLDVYAHVNNSVFFTYIETARIRYMVDVGIRSPQLKSQELAFILAHINCDFKRPIFYQQRVEVGTRITEIKRTSLRLEHRIETDGQLAATGYGVVVQYDYARQESVPFTQNMRQKVELFEGRGF